MSSDKALKYFPSNTAYRFSTHLNIPLVLHGEWKVALVEADITSSIPKSEAIYLYSNTCGESIVDGEQKPLLRRLTASGPGIWSSLFEVPHYVPVKITELFDIDIYITDNKNDLASFINQTSTITLHFKAFPFL